MEANPEPKLNEVASTEETAPGVSVAHEGFLGHRSSLVEEEEPLQMQNAEKAYQHNPCK